MMKLHKPGKRGGDVAKDKQQYYGPIFDGLLHSCSVCGHHLAFGHSVRIRQDQQALPIYADCRLQVRRAA